MFNKETEYALRSLTYIQYQNYKQLRPGIACPLHIRYAPMRDAINKLVSEETIQNLARKTTPGAKNPLSELL